MSEACTHNCETCGQSCAQRSAPQNMMERPHPMSSINRVIGVVSGKGGVGKSLITSLLAVSLQRKGYHAAHSGRRCHRPVHSQRSSACTKRPSATSTGHLCPAKAESGIEIMSINLLLERRDRPCDLARARDRHHCQAVLDRCDLARRGLYVRGHAAGHRRCAADRLTSRMPLDGIVVVTSPQDLVSMIVGKAVKMAQLMDVPVIGVVENMSYVECPDCGKKIMLYGEGKTAQAVAEQDLSLLAQMPIDPKLAALCDAGKIGEFQGDWLDEAVKVVENFHNWDLEMEEEEE